MLPQFLPAGVPAVSFASLLALVHATLTLAWFTVLIAATRPLARTLQRPAVLSWLNRLTGCVLLGFGLRLVFERG